MKLLLPILIVCFGFTAANLHQAAAPMIDDAVSAFRECMEEVGSLRDALDMPDAYELDTVEEDTKSELVEKIKKAIKDMVNKIYHLVSDEQRETIKALLEELKDLRKKLKDVSVKDNFKEWIQKLKEKGKEALRKILEKDGTEKGDLNHAYDALARSQVKDVRHRITRDILSRETIQKIREYIKNIESNNPIIKAFKEFVERLREVDLRELLRHIFEGRRDVRSVKEHWENFKDDFKNIGEAIIEKTIQLQEWVKNISDKGFEKLKEKYGIIKTPCLEALEHAKDIRGETAREALEFFRPYKDDLGALWENLKQVLKDSINS